MKTIKLRECDIESLEKKYNRLERAINRAADKADDKAYDKALTERNALQDALQTLGFQFWFDDDNEREPLKGITHRSDAPSNVWEAIERAQKALDDACVSAEVWGTDDDDKISVYIQWGDWKHEHLRAQYILEAIGFEKFSENVIDEDGSDCYSAEHWYKF